MSYFSLLAGVELVHDWRFKSLPPFAYPPALAAHCLSFHKVDARDLPAVHAFVARADEAQAKATLLLPPRATAEAAVPAAVGDGGGGKGELLPWPTVAEEFPSLPDTCVPVLPRGGPGRAQCGPTFVMIGAQKAATTSLFGYLRQHPSLLLPEEKELNFLGSPFTNRGNYYRSNSDYIFQCVRSPPTHLFPSSLPRSLRHPPAGARRAVLGAETKPALLSLSYVRAPLPPPPPQIS